MPTPWKYYLLLEDGRSARIVNDVVSYLGTPKPLQYTPDGWQDISIMWERNMSSYGNIRNFSLTLGFVLDGATILRDGLYKSNVDNRLYLLIQRRVCEVTDTTFRDYYKYFYKGELDFTTAEDKQGESRFEINIMEGGLQKKIKSKENVQYDIAVDEIDVLMDGIELTEKHNFITQAGAYVGGDRLLGVIQTTKEGTAYGVASYSVFKQEEPGDLTTSLQYFLRTAAPVTGMTISGTIQFSELLAGDYTLRLKSSAGQNIILASITDETVYNINQVFNGAEDEKFFLVLDSDTGLTGGTLVETNLSISYTSRKSSTTIKGITAYTLLKRIIAKITGSEDDVYSELLPGLGIVFTSGDAIRGIEGAVIKTTFNDLIKALHVYTMGGWQIEAGVLRYEHRSHFFVTGDAADLGEVKDFTIQPAKDLLFSSVKIGHAEQTVDDVNGKYDFNGYHIYTTPVESVTRELDLLSPYKAGPYEIETLRINLDGKTTTGASADNDVFALVVTAPVDDVYQLDRSITVTGGVPSPETIFNVPLSPKRLLLTHGAWLRGCLKGFEGGKLIFQSANRNKDLVAGGITESANVNITSLAPAMFTPYYFEFETKVPISLNDTLETDPNTSFAATTDYGQDFEGFLMTAGLAPNTMQEQTFRLLASPETDMKKFII